MMTHDPDPDVVRWGLHHINVCAIPNVGSGGAVTQFETDGSQIGYISEGYNEPVDRSSVTQHERDGCQLRYMRDGYDEVAYTNVDNDVVIALALQEELSRVAAAEASGVYNSGQEFIVQQNWISHHGDDEDQQGRDGQWENQKQVDEHRKKEEENKVSIKIKSEEGGEMRISGPSLSGPEASNSVDTLFDSLDIVDESALDGELGKRLNDMVPVPHVPKINGELPSPDEEISDHQRLLDRLQLYDLVENKIQGDGNCQFRSLSDQLYHSSDHHRFVREVIVNQLKSHPDLYEGYVPMAYDDYLKKMSKTGEWGDHVTLQAAADWFGVKIFVITSFKDTCYIEILPSMLKSKRVILLSFWAEVHYNSIYPEGEMPLVEEKKKKKWWMLGA
ncbi:OVARIAN TUMOR DOMAIN-containing deubiquitinating enzyme 9-like isoform X1 [Tripterygium wilfordii]|uniref:OVARIAN TUMOR DOMAIN-containing deubiquitinating enzyme 9-like isoform X1 n=1 Tax=Tripterygium wilfordii TaxID=458696 RepID=UPI0018F84229|nr:OVARIAN TUMOR DOMAIN-containing deubiquitinating enzyme 9-like isoform X1 [Tripterygium wilfordii]XP_038680581.1 OVARIAN TUMOR DOMAIN-containing deubiquitinating enzyme 9-like isoform X1 [Tripterygium wilfordii]